MVLPRRHASTIHVWLSPKAGWPARMMTLRSCIASACNGGPAVPVADHVGGNKSYRPNPCSFVWATVSKTSLGSTAFCRLPGFVKRARWASRMPPDFMMRCFDSWVWTLGNAPSLRQDSGTCSLWWCFGMTDSLEVTINFYRDMFVLSYMYFTFWNFRHRLWNRWVANKSDQVWSK